MKNTIENNLYETVRGRKIHIQSVLQSNIIIIADKCIEKLNYQFTKTSIDVEI